jgi:CRISPR-associated protein Cmx8
MTDVASETAKPKARRPRAPKTAAATGPISLRWNLSELPSSQHKAGLAGLAICVEFLKRQGSITGICEVEALDPAGLTLRVDRAGMQALFDSVYAANLEEQERDKKFQKKTSTGAKVDVEPKEVRDRAVTDKKGVTKPKTFYVYETTIPKGALVGSWDGATADGTQTWLKLWRDVVWGILRGVPATREPYDARAERRTIDDGGEEWDALASKADASVELPSTYYLGAQARSAENVSFRDVARQRFLLHFWPFVVPIYVPAVTGRDGDREFVGYALVVPDILDLEEFVASWETVARERAPEVSGYRPRDAIIDVAAEAGLDVARRVFAVAAQREGKAATKPYVTAVDVFHVEKEGNNIRTRGVTRVDLRRDRANVYERVRRRYWSPLFRRQRINNILDPGPSTGWASGFGRLCATTPTELTIENKHFRHDCQIAFTEVEMTASTDDTPDAKSLDELVYQVARAYVFGKLGSKYDLEWAKAKGTPREKEFNEKKDKLAREAFLAVRSRTGADFVTYFTGTLCSVAQRIRESGYSTLARSLDPRNEAEVERLRSLTLLALSAV